MKKKKLLKYIVIIIAIIIIKIGLTIDFSFFNTENTLENKEDEKIKKNVRKMIYIDLKGAVYNPGVYKIVQNSRIIDVIKKAKGLKKANELCINLADTVKDKEVIYIPSLKDKCNSYIKKDKNNDKINLNSATKNDLLKLKGIGDKKAEAIIKYRNQQEFQKIEDIEKVKGIGNGIFQKIKDKIMV